MVQIDVAVSTWDAAASWTSASLETQRHAASTATQAGAKLISTALKDSLEHYRKTRKDWMTWQLLIPTKGLFIPSNVARVIDKLATEDAVFTCDVGTPVIWAARISP